VFALQAGQLAGPIESSRAFHIVRLETKDKEEVTSIADAQDAITEKIRDTRFKASLETYLQNLWNENYIHVFPKYGSSEWKPTDSLDSPPGGIP
jgi:parvulin-like peptidyl-prolyl isomerase